MRESVCMGWDSLYAWDGTGCMHGKRYGRTDWGGECAKTDSALQRNFLKHRSMRFDFEVCVYKSKAWVKSDNKCWGVFQSSERGYFRCTNAHTHTHASTHIHADTHTHPQTHTRTQTHTVNSNKARNNRQTSTLTEPSRMFSSDCARLSSMALAC